MAGSRVQKSGTIFRRVQGLLRSGALCEEERPMWYDVYAAFQPKNLPTLGSQVPKVEVPKILYPEDIIRVQFYKIFGNPDVVDLANEEVATTCQRFVNKYIELMRSDVSHKDLFARVTDLLRQEGVRLRTEGEVRSSRLQQKELSQPRQEAHAVSVLDIFGEMTVHRNQKEEQDYIIESDADEKAAKT